MVSFQTGVFLASGTNWTNPSSDGAKYVPTSAGSAAKAGLVKECAIWVLRRDPKTRWRESRRDNRGNSELAASVGSCFCPIGCRTEKDSEGFRDAFDATEDEIDTAVIS